MGVSQSVVVDANVAFKWVVDEENSDKADSLALAWHNQGVQISAPYFMPVEVTNILHQRVRRSELSISEAASLIERLLSSDIELHHSIDIHRRALELASRLVQGAVYDCHYLALAEILDCEMWTADERFYRVASHTATRLRLLNEFVASESTG